MRATNVNISAKGRLGARARARARALPRQRSLLRSRLQNAGRPSNRRDRLVFAKAEENNDNNGESKNALLEAFEQYKGDKGEKSGGLKLPKVDIKTPSFKLTKTVSKNVDTEWSVTRKALVDFGLESVSSQDASNMVKDGKAVIVDVRTEKLYRREHLEPSVSLPLYVRAKGGEGSFAKKVVLGSKTTRKNEDFAADAKTLLGDEQRTIIVACSTGGDLANSSNGNGLGRDSLSLRACKELIGAGYKNVRHLDGGITAWKAEGLAVAGFMVRKEKSFLNGRPPVEVDTTPVTEEKYKVLGIPQGQKAFKVWPVVFEALTSSGLKSVNAKEANNLVKNKKATVLDVNNESQFVEGHIKDSVSVPLYIEVEEKRTLWIPLLTLNAVTNILTGSNTRPKVRSETFVEDCKKALGSDMNQSIVVTCGRGGTLSTGGNGKFDKEGKQVVLQKNGIESSSLRAAYELMEAGYKNVVHLEGGNSAWNYANLPMEGQLVQRVFIENKGGVFLSLLTLAYFIYLLQN